MRGRNTRVRLERGVVVLLGVTSFVVAGLLLQSFLSLRSHRAMVEATLGDFSAFAAERVANELDHRFTGLFLDQISLSRSAHYSWAADRVTPAPRPTGERGLPTDAVPFFFSMDGSTLVRHGDGPETEVEAWASEQVTQHVPTYPRPAPYVVLRDHRSIAVVYRKEPRYEGESVYGFVVDLAAFASWYERIVADTPLLPRSLGEEAAAEDLLTVGVHLSPDRPPLFMRGNGSEGEAAWAFAGKAARLAVAVRIDRERAGALVAGGAPGAGLPLLSGLAILTLGLLTVAVGLFQRATRLAGLQEQFVANVSHDLKTPIAQIRMFSETLLRDRMPDPAERARSLGIIHRQSEVLTNLVDNILHASSQRPELRPVPTKLGSLLRDVVDSFDPTVQANDTSIKARYSGPDEVIVDPIAVTRILTNLLDNALRHAGPRCSVTVTVTADGDDDTVHISVEDDGPGIPRAARSRVFERFERLGAEPNATGAGIGLAVVRDLAQRHGGDASVTDGAGRGARIYVTLRLES